jgi:hypothetical protein
VLEESDRCVVGGFDFFSSRSTLYHFRRAVVIDCNVIYSSGSDTAMVTSLAEQTGYWPIFSFLNSVNNLIDLASVGVIGQKGAREILNTLVH